MSFDNLPERTAQHIKNDKARAEFRRLFTDPFFMVREEHENDYGVDICIEALANNGTSPTNIRAHVQLKSSDKECNLDGTFSYSVSTANLNYLLNNPYSFYVFYSIEDDLFYYCTADEVFNEYNKSGDTWRSQKTITVRFINRLDDKSISSIHRAMIESAMMFKEITT